MTDRAQEVSKTAEDKGSEEQGIWSDLKSLGSHLFHAAMDAEDIQARAIMAVPSAVYKENKEEIDSAATSAVKATLAFGDYEIGAGKRAVYNMEHKPVTSAAENLILPGFSLVHAGLGEAYDRLTK